MPTHLRAPLGSVAPFVLLPGDPDRAEYIATTFLSDVRQYNSYRHLYGFTGTFEGMPISVQATGMGCPSAAIVVDELMGLGAKTLIRIGTCGTAQPGIDLCDLIVATAACSLTQTTATLTGLQGYSPAADFMLARLLHDHARRELTAMGSGRVHAGLVASSDLFYDPRETLVPRLTQFGVLALEMEAAALFTLAARERRAAGCLLTVSDQIPTKQRASDAVILQGVDAMARAALATCRTLHAAATSGARARPLAATDAPGPAPRNTPKRSTAANGRSGAKRPRS